MKCRYCEEEGRKLSASNPYCQKCSPDRQSLSRLAFGSAAHSEPLDLSPDGRYVFARYNRPVRVVFVGEAPGPSGKVGFQGWAGRRLRKMCGDDVGFAWLCAEFVNVFDRWPGPQAYKHHDRDGGKGSRFLLTSARRKKKRVLAKLNSGTEEPTVAVLLGKRVASALDFDREFFDPGPLDEGFVGAVVVPHPSGVNRWFNDPANRARFSRFMSMLLRLVSETQVQTRAASQARST